MSRKNKNTVAPGERDGSSCVKALTTFLEHAHLRILDALGPGLEEKVYESAVAIELREGSYKFDRQLPVIFRYRGEAVGEGYADFLVYLDDGTKMVLELKALGTCHEGHKQQTRCYMDFLKADVGIILNFVQLGQDSKTKVYPAIEKFVERTKEIHIYTLDSQKRNGTQANASEIQT